LTKSQIVKGLTEAQFAARVAELEKANAELQAELDSARSKSAEVEHHEWALTSQYEDLKKDFENVHTAYDAVVKEKAKIEENERVKLQRFQDSLRKKLVCHTQFLCQNQVLIVCMTQDQLFHTYGPKVFTDNQMSRIKYNYYINNVSKD
jgi:chromosome segregation ATPase